MIEDARATGRGNGILLECLKAIGVFLGVTLLSGVLHLIVVSLMGLADTDMLYTLCYLWSESVGIALLLLYCRFCEKRSLSSVGFAQEGFCKEYIRGLVLGFCLFSSFIALGLLLGVLKFNGLSPTFNPLLIVLFFVGFMIQGMFEEVLCRGYMMVSMARKSPVIAAVVCNSLLFSLLHIGNPGFGLLPFFNITLFGVFISFYTLKRGNLWAAGALHSIWNFAQGCFFGLSVSGIDALPSVFSFESTGTELFMSEDFGPEGGLAVTLVLCVALLVLLFRMGLIKKERVSGIN